MRAPFSPCIFLSLAFLITTVVARDFQVPLTLQNTDEMATALKGWHPGERVIHQKLLYDDPSISMAWMWISGDMPEEHRVFYTTRIPFVAVTTLDAQGRPWGSILAAQDGRPGFLRSPIETVLQRCSSTDDAIDCQWNPWHGCCRAA
ncbi:hypothetical protein EW146_g7846 [Bondarzewia mesenterica]|uniref:Pyridoxamine 5'-phosphate oxidase putative domain-containing protein n=1 Tax=Bondarzewia mesenterica TaxID=1095465 RepID=A0A4S4LJN4_9AGAM|nr:hypothetical protein EW146_g7846 [Bondarzewia mesenterica]